MRNRLSQDHVFCRPPRARLLIATCGCLALSLAFAVPAQARKWTDITGQYSIEADLIGFNDQQVIIQRKDKELGAVPIEKLSKADRDFLKSKEAAEIHGQNVDQMQTWTMAKDLKVVGKVVAYTRRDVTLQRRRGKTYVNNLVFKNLPQVYQAMLPRIVSYMESTTIEDGNALEAWVKTLRGQPRTYRLEGVILELENGDEYGVPFFLFSKQDQEVLKPGWEAWQKEHEDAAAQENHSLMLQSLASSYHRDRQVKRQIATMHLNLQAIQAGLTSAWEVTLYPVRGNPNPPRWVVMLGRNSQQATEAALRQNPGFVSGPVRKVSP
ncbi:MAG: hypothetical protein MI861_23310 [Pirellulales bacterium]|nr:hypothetical protein [Pirellulales bacterium]